MSQRSNPSEENLEKSYSSTIVIGVSIPAGQILHPTIQDKLTFSEFSLLGGHARSDWTHQHHFQYQHHCPSAAPWSASPPDGGRWRTPYCQRCGRLFELLLCLPDDHLSQRLASEC